MEKEREGGSFRLDVPLDASAIEGFKPEAPVKVAVVGKKGVLASQTVQLDGKGHGQATLTFPKPGGGVRVIVGPGDASDEEIVNLQTITLQVSAAALAASKLKLHPVIVPPYYWWWWLRWCRTFVITGRVVCPDGSPVPGATVCAFDVDAWWWWSSVQQVGCAVTDATGAFAIRFRWCCGWWPYWWFEHRFWQLEPRLVDEIRGVLKQSPKLPLPVPSPRPSLGIFHEIVQGAGVLTQKPSPKVDVAAIDALRKRLLTKLPANEGLANLQIWPWAPWAPWWDCTPDIIFKVTQPCQGVQQVIVDEHYSDARWNIPTNLNVTLTATNEACCITHDPPPEGNCVLISRVCDDLLDTIGGNIGAPAAPAGYLNPGAVAVFGDRPYAGVVNIAGLFGSAANVDYYEFVWSTTSGGPFNAMPPAAAGGFSRVYWGPQLGGGPVGFHAAGFPFTPIDGRLVIESREHFEATNDPLSWGTTRFWVANYDLLMQWLTATTFADDTYYLQLVGYALAGGHLGKPQVLPLCDTREDNSLVLTIDNATSPLEPEADIVDVRINGASAGPCSNIDASKGGALEVDFVAYDVDSHLAYYSLIATYGKNLAVDLLAAPGATLTPVALGAIPAADFTGPDYGAARLQGATAPNWRCGGVRLTIPNLHNAFPETCCYQIELRVYKRTVVSCNHDYTPSELSYYSLTVVV